MIAVFCAAKDHVKMIPDTKENRCLLANAAKEFGTDAVWKNCDELDKILSKAKPTTEAVVNSTATFIYRQEW